jgi:hypothetical protein
VETARLVLSLLYTGGAAFIILGVRMVLLEAASKAYCKCRHEFNEHNIVPAYYAPIGVTKYSDETCKLCSCKKYTKNEDDKRNTPPVKFFPRLK